MRQKFAELVSLFKRGVRSGILFTFEFAFLMMEYHVSAGVNVVIEYEDGKEKEIRNLKDLAELKREVFKEAIKDPEIVEILEKVYQED